MIYILPGSVHLFFTAVIYIRQTDRGNIEIAHRYINVESRPEARSYLSVNIFLNFRYSIFAVQDNAAQNAWIAWEGASSAPFCVSTSLISKVCEARSKPSSKEIVHRKKRFTSFPSPAGMSLPKLHLGRNNSVMTSLFPPRESLVVTSRLGTGNSRTFFYGVALCSQDCA